MEHSLENRREEGISALIFIQKGLQVKASSQNLRAKKVKQLFAVSGNDYWQYKTW